MMEEDEIFAAAPSEVISGVQEIPRALGEIS
jgi:hypothetical protein